ncbi:MAG: cobalt-precorrin-6A reductase [Rhodospirillaceae bacterium]|nr:cobalt-precorrin-6A reductase [Rhodospirillaceae bacterium]
MSRLKVLVLGGTTEAAGLAIRLADDPRFEGKMSLAGVTVAPRRSPLATRTGGFGGIVGLTHYLDDNRIAVLIDATHPFANQMTLHAARAAGNARIPLLTVLRPPWRAEAGDQWIPVPDLRAAASALGNAPQRVFLTIGRKNLVPFRADAEHFYLVRSVDPPDPAALPMQTVVITDRGPFDAAAEQELMAQYRITVLVTRNAGGDATRAKLTAARSLGLPVIMVDRPPAPADSTNGTVVSNVEAAWTWLERHHAAAALRGV